MSYRITALAITALVTTLALSACAADRRDSPTEPSDPRLASVVAPSLRAALGDARERVLPTVDAEIQTALDGALLELQSALDAGQVGRSRRAIAAARALLASHADTPDGDSADLASVSMLLTVADEAVNQD